jgi:CubicO group peptidase (beta-lactamase class C family)
MPAVTFAEEESTYYTVAERMSRYNVPGLSFALIHNGEIEWVAGYGVKAAGTSDPVSPETLFQAGSIAKPVAAVAAMRMSDAGLIDLDADIQTVLKEYVIPEGEQTSDNPVTFRNLLSHTAGITPGGYRGYARGEAYPTALQVVRGLPPANSAKVTVATPPGAELAYSGGGYTVVQIAIEDVTGDIFERALDGWVLSVLGISGSTYARSLPQKLEGATALGHLPDGTIVPGGWRVHPEMAAAGLWSTASDLATFAVELRKAYLGKGSLLQHGSAVELLTEQMDGHAFGFVLQLHGENPSFSHAGGTAGYRAFMTMDLHTGNGAVIMTNSDQGMDLVRELLRAASFVYGWEGFKPTVTPRITLGTDTLAALEGTYDFGNGVKVRIALQGSAEALSITFPNGDEYGLVPTGPMNFVDPESGVTVDFEGAEEARRVIVYGQVGTRLPH